MKFQKTIEREVDFLYKVMTTTKESFLLHLEFQVEDDKKMIDRMVEYHGLVYAKKKMRMEHVVIYLGNKSPKMRTKLRPEEIFSGFHLLNIHQFDPEKLIASQVPSVIITAILCDFPKNKVEAILRLLLKELKASAKSKNDLEKYLNQLIILARIRKFEIETIKIVKEMTLNIDIETSILYQRGMEEGMEKGLEKGLEKGAAEKTDDTIRQLLLSKLLTDKQIADTLQVSIYRVRKIKARLPK
jgi:predicted transposase YdaD